MAHYAQLDDQNIVIQVIVIDNQYDTTEEQGLEYCSQLLGGLKWIKTSYNGTIRKNFASRGYSYDRSRDAFIPPRPYPSWQLDEDTCSWQPPLTPPQDGKFYSWDEYTTSWRATSF